MSLTKLYTDTIVERFASIGGTFITKELGNISYNHDTFNLHDSYGWAVYVHGKIARMGKTPTKATETKKFKGKTISGANEIEKFFKSRYSPQKPIELVIAVAMPYGSILEDNMGYEVFAMAADNLERASKMIKGATFRRMTLRNG